MLVCVYIYVVLGTYGGMCTYCMMNIILLYVCIIV